MHAANVAIFNVTSEELQLRRSDCAAWMSEQLYPDDML